jgi:nicotinate-nucleotide pyrophosphorylase (carboxylating)
MVKTAEVEPENLVIDCDALRRWLAEDLPQGDITSEATVGPERQARGDLVAKAELILAGSAVFSAVFRLLDPAAEFEVGVGDGAKIHPGLIPIRVRGRARALLGGERTALNLVQRMSGIATATRRYVEAVEGTGARILDSRKTMPGLRSLDKYAVKIGGGLNHRRNLSHAVLIKENHIRMAGGVRAALEATASMRSRAAWIEIEVTNQVELRLAIEGGPDVILLDNMTPEQTAECVRIVRAANHEILLEASGGITLANVRKYAESGVDWISVGALTHSTPSVDLSFEIEPE